MMVAAFLPTRRAALVPPVSVFHRMGIRVLRELDEGGRKAVRQRALEYAYLFVVSGIGWPMTPNSETDAPIILSTCPSSFN